MLRNSAFLVTLALGLPGEPAVATAVGSPEYHKALAVLPQLRTTGRGRSGARAACTAVFDWQLAMSLQVTKRYRPHM